MAAGPHPTAAQGITAKLALELAAPDQSSLGGSWMSVLGSCPRRATFRRSTSRHSAAPNLEGGGSDRGRLWPGGRPEPPTSQKCGGGGREVGSFFRRSISPACDRRCRADRSPLLRLGGNAANIVRGRCFRAF
jgi:hypothetical protein